MCVSRHFSPPPSLAPPTILVIMHNGLWLHYVLQITIARQNTHAHMASEAASVYAGRFAYAPTSMGHLTKRAPEVRDEAHSAVSFYFWSTEELNQSSALERREIRSRFKAGKINRGNCTDIKRSRRAEAITWHNLINHLTMRGRALF